MRSIGIDLEPWVKDGRLHFHAARPALLGLEQHLVAMYRAIEEAKPAVVVVDPINNLTSAGIADAVKATLLRLVDYLKTRHITALFTSLTSGDAQEQTTDIGISSLMDTWILLRASEKQGRRHRGIYVLKSRGMRHSNELCPYRITDRGIHLIPQGPRPSEEEDPMKPTARKGAAQWNLRLYVAGQTPKCIAAFANLKKLCEERLGGNYSIEVIDLLKKPQLASGDQILAIPTLVRRSCRRRSRRSSATSRTPSGCSSASTSW